MTQTNGHSPLNLIETANETYRHACWEYLRLALHGASNLKLQTAADAIFEARKAYVR